jgi:hypothetical protein
LAGIRPGEIDAMDSLLGRTEPISGDAKMAERASMTLAKVETLISKPVGAIDDVFVRTPASRAAHLG